MSIFESYSILCELLPMYDYLEHWIWLMNQLSRKTRQIWKDYRLAFKNLDRETQTVLRYNKEFDDQLAKFLVRSSVLSCMSINFWISSDESFKKFVEMLPKFDDDKVICFEFCGYKTKDYADFECQLIEQVRDQNDDSIIEQDQMESNKEIIVSVDSLIDFKTFEYKLSDKYSDYHPFSVEPDQVLTLLKSITSSNSNNPKLFFTTARGIPEIFVHTHNLPDIENQKAIGEKFSCCEKCIKCTQSGICEMFIDDFVDGSVNCFDSCPKTHIVFREKTEPIASDDFEFNKPIDLKYPDLKTVTFKANKMDFRSIYRFLSTNTDAQINIEMGSKHVQVCHACDSYSILYFWNFEKNTFQALRFDSLLFSINSIWSSLELDKPKAKLNQKNKQTNSNDNTESLENKSGYFAVDVISAVYINIQNLKITDCEEELPFDYSNVWFYNPDLQIIFFKANVNSCYCLSEYARMKQEVKKENSNEQSKEETKIEQKDDNANLNQDPKAIPMLANGRKKGFYREYFDLDESQDSIEDIKKKILEVDERRDIAVKISFIDDNFNDTSFIDFLFSRRLTQLQLNFLRLNNQQLLDHIASKIEEHSNTLFAIVCTSKSDEERKGFYNITSAQRKK